MTSGTAFNAGILHGHTGLDKFCRSPRETQHAPLSGLLSTYDQSGLEKSYLTELINELLSSDYNTAVLPCSQQQFTHQAAEPLIVNGQSVSALSVPDVFSRFRIERSEKEAKHLRQECKPCAYYHKAGSCKWGSACDYCHFCPDGEVKLRKKEKIQAMRLQKKMVAELSSDMDLAQPAAQESLQLSPVPILADATEQTLQTSSDMMLADSQDLFIDIPSEMRTMYPSLWPTHEAKHIRRECNPCAYYHKPDSCRWGEACDFCHLCPEGEIKLRKKDKIQAMRLQKKMAAEGSCAE